MNKDIESYMNEYEKIQHQINSYESQINYLRMLLDQKNEALEEQIVYFKRKIDSQISLINDKIDANQQELNKLSLNHKTKIRLGDIIDEILSITEIDINDIEVFGNRSFVYYPSIESFNAPLTRNAFLEYVATHTPPVKIHIYIFSKNSHVSFSSSLIFEGNLSDRESNGKMLLEHKTKKMPVRIHNFEENGNGKILGNTPILLDGEGLEDIFCSFNLKQIIDFKDNYENDILSKAVINCLDKQKVQENSKQKTYIFN